LRVWSSSGTACSAVVLVVATVTGVSLSAAACHVCSLRWQRVRHRYRRGVSVDIRWVLLVRIKNALCVALQQRRRVCRLVGAHLPLYHIGLCLAALVSLDPPARVSVVRAALQSAATHAEAAAFSRVQTHTLACAPRLVCGLWCPRVALSLTRHHPVPRCWAVVVVVNPENLRAARRTRALRQVDSDGAQSVAPWRSTPPFPMGIAGRDEQSVTACYSPPTHTHTFGGRGRNGAPFPSCWHAHTPATCCAGAHNKQPASRCCTHAAAMECRCCPSRYSNDRVCCSASSAATRAAVEQGQQ
jgi:hypothetical protein